MHSVILESLSTKSDLKAVVGAISNILSLDTKGAVELAKSLPLTLAKDLPEKEAMLMADMFSSMGAGVKVDPPLETPQAKPPVETYSKKSKKQMSTGGIAFIVLCLIAAALFAGFNHKWIVEQFKPSPAKASRQLQKGNMNEARRSLQRQLNKNPTDTELLVLKGKFYIGAGRKRMDDENWRSYGEAGALPELDSAVEFFRKAESLDPKDGSIPRWLSIAEQMRRAFPEAEIAARRAVSIDPRDPDNWNQLGSVLVSEERITQAEQAFYNALKIDPNNAAALKNLTIVNLYYTKDAERAAGFLFAFLKQKESFTDVDSRILRTDLTKEMIGDFNPPWAKMIPPPLPLEEYERRRSLIANNPRLRHDPLLQEQLGMLYMSIGEIKLAEGCFMRAVQLNANIVSSRKMLAIIYMMEANYENALKTMEMAVKVDDRDPFFWKNIGVLQKYFRASPQANKAFNRYFALGGDSFAERIRREM
ncbi:MAG: hypothetical protein LBU89_02020 [Fibromonadaceae bacterium]|jgi:Flp pilus assembly protein TadD|nr:hypothetical protein [Fibromonadaceae bacterium]